MRRRPPRSTRLPYTTLFRSAWSSISAFTSRSVNSHGPLRLVPSTRSSSEGPISSSRWGVVMPTLLTTSSTGPRSEEHTSELQSRQYLVCRLLLEKKNQQKSKYDILCHTAKRSGTHHDLHYQKQ